MAATVSSFSGSRFQRADFSCIFPAASCPPRPTHPHCSFPGGPTDSLVSWLSLQSISGVGNLIWGLGSQRGRTAHEGSLPEPRARHAARDQTLRTLSSCASSCSSPCERGKEASTLTGGKPEGTDITEKKGRTQASEELAMDKKWLLSICSPPGPHPPFLLQVLGVYQGLTCLWSSGELAQREAHGETGVGALLPPSLWPGFLAVALNPQFPLPSGSPVPTAPAFSWL